MIGWLVRSIVQLIGFAILAAEYYTWPSLDLRLVRPLLSYSTFRTLEALAFVVFTSADLLIIGLWLNPADLGRYALRARQHAAEQVHPIINSVAFPARDGQGRRPRRATMPEGDATDGDCLVSCFGIAAIAPGRGYRLRTMARGGRCLRCLRWPQSFGRSLVVVNYLQGIGDARAGGARYWCYHLSFTFIVGCHWGAIGVYAALGSPLSRHQCPDRILVWPLDYKVLLIAPLRVLAASMIAAVTALRPPCCPTDPRPPGFNLDCDRGSVYGIFIVLAFGWFRRRILVPTRSSRVVTCRKVRTRHDGTLEANRADTAVEWPLLLGCGPRSKIRRDGAIMTGSDTMGVAIATTGTSALEHKTTVCLH
jgi:hypothetical protein